jgi:hypothetical protein
LGLAVGPLASTRIVTASPSLQIGVALARDGMRDPATQPVASEGPAGQPTLAGHRRAP